MAYERILEGDILSRLQRGRGWWKKTIWQMRPYWGKLMVLGILALGVGAATTISLTSKELRTRARDEAVDISLIPEQSMVKANEEKSFDVLLNAKGNKVVSVKLAITYDENVWNFVEMNLTGVMDEVVEARKVSAGLVTMSLGIKPKRSAEGSALLITPVVGSERIARLTLRAKDLDEVQNTVVGIKTSDGLDGTIVMTKTAGLDNMLGEIRDAVVNVEIE